MTTTTSARKAAGRKKRNAGKRIFMACERINFCRESTTVLLDNATIF
jgi:hypothetical protein